MNFTLRGSGAGSQPGLALSKCAGWFGVGADRIQAEAREFGEEQTERRSADVVKMKRGSREHLLSVTAIDKRTSSIKWERLETMSIATVILILLAVAFAWSMGAHYTGACMGMPHATGSIGLMLALWMMALLAFLGATFLSHKVLLNIGHGILVTPHLGSLTAIAILSAAFLLTTLFTQRRIPTSTIQILVFSIIGAGLAYGAGIR
jgi:hypothetical protein